MSDLTSPNTVDLFEAVNSKCEALKTPSYLELSVSIVILIGLVISYLPQHYRIISRGTSEGISPYFVLLGTTSATAGFANILTVPPSRTAIGCCKELGGFECAAGLLGVAQLGFQWLCFSLILVLFLIFFRSTPTDEADVEDETAGAHPDTPAVPVKAPGWRTALSVGLLCVLHGLIVVILTGVFYLALPKRLNLWANFLGVSAGVLAAVQYVPQIYTTYRLKHVGSLSIPMMCIQTPGGLLFAASLYGRLGFEGWSTWFIYILTAAMQGCVLIMGISYELRKQRQHNHHEDSDDRYANLQRPRPIRNYSEGWESGLPGPFTGHAERYIENEEDRDLLESREAYAADRESQPLLKPGGIGNPYRSDDYPGRFSDEAP